jgi:hypothetical protein
VTLRSVAALLVLVQERSHGWDVEGRPDVMALEERKKAGHADPIAVLALICSQSSL